MESKRLPILIVGATGRLGSLVTKHALANPNLLVNILVRNPQKNPELAESVQKAGGKVIQGDLEKPETLKDVTKGIHTVISIASQMNDKADIEGTFALIDDSISNGVERFSPCDYAENLQGFSREELSTNIAMERKLKVHDYLKGKTIKGLHFWPGVFVDTFFEMNAKKFGYWGNKEKRWDLTTYDDTARVVVAAVADEKRTGTVVISGNDVSITEVTEIYNRVRGANVEPIRYGSLEELKVQWEEAKKADKNSLPALFLGVQVVIYDERSKFPKNTNNEFPEIKLTTVEEYLIQNPEIKIAQSH